MSPIVGIRLQADRRGDLLGCIQALDDHRSRTDIEVQTFLFASQHLLLPNVIPADSSPDGGTPASYP